MKESIRQQGIALSRMHGDVLENIAEYAQEFRDIITDFTNKFGRPPSADELLWIASEHAGRDITKEK
jgi:hypothetical protein